MPNLESRLNQAATDLAKIELDHYDDQTLIYYLTLLPQVLNELPFELWSEIDLHSPRSERYYLIHIQLFTLIYQLLNEKYVSEAELIQAQPVFIARAIFEFLKFLSKQHRI